MPTQEELQAEFDQQQRELNARHETEQAFPNLPAAQQVGHGAIKNLDKVQLGARDLLEGMKFPTLMGGRTMPGVTDDEKVRLARYEAMNTPAATVGEVGADIATLALPGGAIANTMQAPHRLMYLGTRLTKALDRLRRSAPVVAGETALTAGYEGVKMPEPGQTRAGNAGQAAAWQAGLGSIGPLARLRNAGKVTKEGRQMLDQGVPLTPGMARDDWTTSLERRMAELPFAGPRVQGLQDEAMRVWNINTLNEVKPKGSDVIASGGFDGFKQLQARFKDGYQSAWGQVKPENIRITNFTNKTAGMPEQFAKRLPPADAEVATSLLGRVGDDIVRFAQTGDARILEQADDVLRNAADPQNQLLRESLDEIRAGLRAMLPKDADQAVRELDGQYRKYMSIQNASNRVRAQERGGSFTPRDLQTGVKTNASPRQAVSGRGPMQDQATLASDTLARVMPERSQINVSGDVAPWLLAGAGSSKPGVVGSVLGTSAALANDPMRRFLLGEMPNQQSIMAYMLRAGRQGTATGQN